MKKSLHSRILAVIISLILAVSVPVFAYAQNGDQLICSEEKTERGNTGLEVPADASNPAALADSTGNPADASASSDNTETPADALAPSGITKVPADVSVPSDITEAPEDASASSNPAQTPAGSSDTFEIPEDITTPAAASDTPEDFLPASDAAAQDERIPEEISPADAPAQEAKVEAAGASYTVDSGECGAKAKWKIYYDSDLRKDILSITGSGDMYDFDNSSAPWAEYWSVDQIIIGKNITSIGSYAFSDMTWVGSVIFKGTAVREIHNCAFSGCEYLTEIVIPSGVTSIGEKAFYGCDALSFVLLPSTLTKIGEDAFDYCCSLSEISIPGSVTLIGYNALSYCNDIYYPGSASQWAAIGGENAVSAYAAIHTSRSLADAQVALTKTSYTYTGKAIVPQVTVTLGGEPLTEGVDYRIVCRDNINCGTAKATVYGIRGYYGSIDTEFTITQKSISKATVSGVKSTPYAGGKAVTLDLEVKVKFGEEYVTLTKDQDYTLKYANNKKISTSSSKASVTITGKGNYKGSLKRTFSITKISLNKAGVYSVYGKYYYTGSTVKPVPTVYLYTDSGRVTLKKDRDYTLKYTNNKAVSTSKTKAKITITGKGSYKGSVSCTFKIVKRPNSSIVSRARKLVGKAKYSYGGCGPKYFDCSGLVGYCITGKNIRVGSSSDYYNNLPRVSKPQPGDIVCTPSHSGIYIGNGKMVHAADARLGIRIDNVMPGMRYVREAYPLEQSAWDWDWDW